MKILLLIDYSSEFSRGLLKGIIHYSKDYGPWTFYKLPSFYKTLYGKKGVIEWAKKWNADAVIGQWDAEDIDLLRTLNIPIILKNSKERSTFFSNITGDYYSTGVMAAKFFQQKKFNNFAFYGLKGAIWSKERAEGYRNEIEKIKGNYYYFETDDIGYDQWGKSQIKLFDWLVSLPKPVALFACDDSFALQVSEICKINNIDIPNQIALLGVDNDELICNLSDPPISSIVLDVEKGGYDVGRYLHQLVKKEKTDTFNIVVNPVRVETRLSTERYVISNKYILTVVNHIEKNFTTTISINDLIKLVPLSRRILEVKFKEEMGTPIYQFILKCRIDLFAQLLVTTDKTMLDIALRSGFNDIKNLSRTFKKFKNCSPIEYKRKFGIEY
jgi:LacI family transcriptional regulator